MHVFQSILYESWYLKYDKLYACMQIWYDDLMLIVYELHVNWTCYVSTCLVKWMKELDDICCVL